MSAAHFSSFADRYAAGVALGEALQQQGPLGEVLVLGLPRGGVPVAAEVARALQAPLDVLVVRKIGFPQQPELAIGAVAPGNVVLRDPMPGLPSVDQDTFARLLAREQAELERRERVYRAGRGPLELQGRTVVLVDDGLATGATMRAAVRSARTRGAARVIVAVPVASPHAVQMLRREGAEVFALHTPVLVAIAQWYDDFTQLDDATVCGLLHQGHT